MLSAASATTKLVAQPGGTVSFESYAEPRRVHRAGGWVDIDTRLVAAEGVLRPAAVAADVEFSAGGDRPFVTMRGAGADFSLAWPRPLPPAVVAGDTVTYPQVYPDVDLVVRATKGGFSHVLVVKTPAAAANPQVRSTTYRMSGSAQVTEADGVLRVAGPQGELARAPRAAAWDSAQPVRSAAEHKQLRIAGVTPAVAAPSTVRAPGDTARLTDLDVRVDAGALTVAVGEDFVGKASYPLYIDPTFDTGKDYWVPINDNKPNNSWTSGSGWPREVARVGSNWENHGDIWRAHFRFNTQALKGKRVVNSPSLDVLVNHTGACAGESVQLHKSNHIVDNPTWNRMKDALSGHLQTLTAKANNTCKGQNDHWLKFGNVGNLVRDASWHQWNDLTFGFRIASENGGHWAKIDPNHVALKAEYEHRPHSPEPTRMSPGGGCNRTWPGNWINDNTPVLYGKAQDGDGSVRLTFDVTGPTDPAWFTSGWFGSNEERDFNPPPLADGNYDFRVEGTDDKDTTGFSHQCFFRVDATPPTTPSIRRTSGTPELGKPITLELTASDALSGMRRFQYGVGVDVQQHSQDSGGTTSITFTPEAGRTHIYVWAQDHAGNYSTRAEFNFFTGRITESAPQGVWRFNGDTRDDSGAGRQLTFGAGASFGPDRAGRAGSALALDGTACAELESPVRGDGEFTVAGWVKLTDKSTYRAMVAQVGKDTVSFMVTYSNTRDRWEAALASEDSGSPQWMVAGGPAGVPLNTWQHVAATVDPVGKVLRLFIDGKPAGETDIRHATWHSPTFRVGCGGNVGGRFHNIQGAIDNVGVWRGLLSEQQIAAAAQELPAGPAGAWPLRGDGANSVAPANTAAVPAAATWTDDPFGRARSALALDGTQCARTAAPTVRTDESFTVSAWVNIRENNGTTQTVVAQDGGRISGWYLGARDDTPNRAGHSWAFHMKAGDDEKSEAWEVTTGPGTVAVGRWTMLTGSYDATARRLALYVDGKLIGTKTAPGPAWHADGPTTIGCARFQSKPVDQILGAVSDVRVWRGVLTDAQVAHVRGGNDPVTVEGLWMLDGPDSDAPTYLTDTSGKGRDLTIKGEYSWVRDRGKGRDGALGLQLSGESCAQTSGPALRTDGSFTVAAWVLLDKTDGTHIVASQAGKDRANFTLGYSAGAGRWRFTMAAGDQPNAATPEALSKSAPEPGRWTHVAGVYDLPARKLRLYVDGQLQSEADAPTSPWAAAGPTLIGCAGTIDGRRFESLGGVVDDVRAWTSTVHPDRIGDLANAGLTP